MRQIATLPDADAARTLSDYLLTLQIETQLQPEGNGWAVWVCDEDRVAKAREELADFLKDPADARFVNAGRAARALREREEHEERAYEKLQAHVERKLADVSAGNRPYVTLILVVASVLVSLGSGTAFIVSRDQKVNLENPVLEAVLIKSADARDLDAPTLNQVASGQIWRLVTPMFLHFGPFHLLFNLFMLRDLGAAVEARRGSRRFLILVLVLTVACNFAQFRFGYLLKNVGPEGLKYNPLFGGMSGVLYGLFGYLWMKSRFAPELGLYMHPNTVVFMIAWFFLCMTGGVGPVANMAHLAGLVLGIIIGAAPHLVGRVKD